MDLQRRRRRRCHAPCLLPLLRYSIGFTCSFITAVRLMCVIISRHLAHTQRDCLFVAVGTEARLGCFCGSGLCYSARSARLPCLNLHRISSGRTCSCTFLCCSVGLMRLLLPATSPASGAECLAHWGKACSHGLRSFYCNSICQSLLPTSTIGLSLDTEICGYFAGTLPTSDANAKLAHQPWLPRQEKSSAEATGPRGFCRCRQRRGLQARPAVRLRRVSHVRFRKMPSP